MIELKINGKMYQVDVDPETPLLWVIRDHIGLTGTKYGCGIPVSMVGKDAVTTIEGISPNRSHAVQKAWIEEQVPQCGYCQSGQIMATVALLKKTTAPADDQNDEAMTNICRCGTYQKIRKAIHRAAAVKA